MYPATLQDIYALTTLPIRKLQSPFLQRRPPQTSPKSSLTCQTLIYTMSLIK